MPSRGMASRELRATQGPEEEVGSLERACARFAPNLGLGLAGGRSGSRTPAGRKQLPVDRLLEQPASGSPDGLVDSLLDEGMGDLVGQVLAAFLLDDQAE